MQPPGGGFLVVVSLLLAAGAAGADPPGLHVRLRCPPGPAPSAVRPSADALATFGARCAPCHGAGGHGDGPVAAGLTVKPRRFSDAFWQDAVSDEHLARVILEGGFAVKKSSAMPAHPDLKDRAGDLVAVVRSFRSPTGSVAVEAVTGEGAVVASVSVDARADGSGELTLPVMPPGAVALVLRVAGRAEPFCRIAASAPGALRGAACATPTAPHDPR